MFEGNTAMIFNNEQSSQIYYVYAYLRKSDSSFYYIGKGKGRRAFRKDKRIPPPQDKSRIILLYQNLTENQAFLIEKLLIEYYGRKNIGTGRLLNLTDGGEGSSGYKPTKETLEKQSKSLKGRVSNRKGIKMSEEQKEKLRKSILGQKRSEETKAKHRANWARRKQQV